MYAQANPDGFIDDDLCEVLGKDRNVCARIRLDVEREGWVRRTDLRRKNDKGSQCVVFVYDG